MFLRGERLRVEGGWGDVTGGVRWRWGDPPSLQTGMANVVDTEAVPNRPRRHIPRRGRGPR